MANENSSFERIAADILIAMIQNAANATQKNALCNPEKSAEHYKAIYNAVKDAKYGQSDAAV